MDERLQPLENALAEASRHLQSNNYLAARVTLLRSMVQTYEPSTLYEPAAEALQKACMGMGDWRGAVACAWYRKDVASAMSMDRNLPSTDRAKTRLLGMALGGQSDQNRQTWREAGELFQQGGQIARAAICFEKSGDWDRAIQLWTRVADWLEQNSSDLYVSALVQFDIARCAKELGKPKAAHQHAVHSVYLLEEAADRFEEQGRRDRAFDCFQTLISLGRVTGIVEHALEGFVNVTRILREDGLKEYALKSWGQGIEFLGAHGEQAAAATMAKELSKYARSNDMHAVANWAMLEQARLSNSHANSLLSSDGPADLVENALLHTAQCYAEMGQYGRVGEVFQQLGQLPLEESRKQHYARASQRYQQAQNYRVDVTSPTDEEQEGSEAPVVWHVDVIEWEQHGNPIEIGGDILIEPSTWSLTTRRRALLVTMAGLGVSAARDHNARFKAKLSLVEHLGSTELYATLSALEALFRDDSVQVRVAVMSVLGRFLFKRTLPLLQEGLADDHQPVVEAARESLGSMSFIHAFDPLTRIYREQTDKGNRMAALRALVSIERREAIDWLVERLEIANPVEIEMFSAVLDNGAPISFVEAVSRNFGRFPKPVQSMLKVKLNL